MPITKSATKGMELQLSIASTLTTIGGVTLIDGPDAKVQFWDATDLGSGVSLENGEPTGHTDPGTVSGDLFFDPTDTVHLAMFAYLASPAKADWAIVLPAASSKTMSFNGSLETFKPNAALNDGFKASYSIKLASLATIA